MGFLLFTIFILALALYRCLRTITALKDAADDYKVLWMTALIDDDDDDGDGLPVPEEEHV